MDLLVSLEHAIAHPKTRAGVSARTMSASPQFRAVRGYPRRGHRLAPHLLKELLLGHLPCEVVRGTPYEGRRLCDLDQRVWDHLSLGAVTRLASLVVARGAMAGYHREVVARQIPAPPPDIRLEDLQLEPLTRQILAREGFEGCPESLGRLTIGGLLMFQGFDAHCLIDLLTALEIQAGRPGRPDPSLTAEAEALLKMPEAQVIHFSDPRLSAILRRLDAQSNTVAEMAESVLRRRIDPPEPAQLTEQFRQLRQKIERMKELPLDEELREIFACDGNSRDGEILAAYYGWDGGGGATAEVVGRKHRLTRERVRQVCDRLIKRVRNVKVFAPALDRALTRAGECTVGPLRQIQEEFDAARIATCPFPLESLNAVARFLSREPPLAIVEIGKLRIVTRAADVDALRAVVQAARQVTKKSGLGSLAEVSAALARRRRGNLGRDFVREALQSLEDFAWLDNRRCWFRVGFPAHFGLAHLIDKILSVAGRIEVALMRAAILRCRRRTQRLPSAGVLLEYCRQMPGVRVQGTAAIAQPRRDWRKCCPASSGQSSKCSRSTAE